MAHPQQRETKAVAHFLDSVASAHASGATGKGLAHEITHNNGIQVPEAASKLLDGVAIAAEQQKGDPEEVKGVVLKTILDGVAHFEREHGFKPSSSMIAAALDQGYVSGLPLNKVPGLPVDVSRFLDSASNAHHDQLALQPNRAVIGVLSTFVEAMPFATMLPTDIGSNKAPLIIVEHKSRSSFGNYAAGASLDGINAGDMFLDSQRVVQLSTNGGGKTAPLTAIVSAKFTGTVPDAVTGSNPAVKLLRGRTEIMVNGVVVAAEVRTTSGSGVNQLAGSVTIGDTDYPIGGTVNSDTGAISVTTTTADLPANTLVEAIVYIDYEAAPDLAPRIGVETVSFELYARPSRGVMQVSHDAMGQFQAEIQVDPMSEALLTLRAQFALEGHYRMLARLKQIGKYNGNARMFDFDWSSQKDQKTRDQIWLNFAAELSAASQDMANANNDHGITTIYATGFAAMSFMSLPSTIWQPSGIKHRPGIYRMGRLFGLYDVYYTPKVLIELTSGGTTSEMLCIGRSDNPVFNPVLTGAAVSPMFLPTALANDLVHGQAFYCRDFKDINPYKRGAQSAMLFTVTNLR